MSGTHPGVIWVLLLTTAEGQADSQGAFVAQDGTPL
jgi:hypothetical protein